jgi:hypothetical protein
MLMMLSREDMRTTDWRAYLESNESIWSILNESTTAEANGAV